MDFSVDFIAGCIGGAAGVLVGHPFDTVKVRLQGSSGVVYKGTVGCFKEVVRKESFRGLYKGVSSPLYSLAAINAVVFGVQGNVLRRMKDRDALSSHAAAGAAAGFIQCAICSPMELAKIKLQSQGEGLRAGTRGQYTGSMDCLRKIHRLEGLRGLCRGMNATILREVPAFGAYFLTYEWICRKLTLQGQQCSTGVMLFAGGMAGIAAWVVTYPVDVIKTRIQNDGELRNRKFVYKYTGYVDCVRKSITSEGYKVLSKGLTPTLLRAFPTNAATFTVVTWSLRYMRPEAKEHELSEEVETV
ncbi:mitochondrial basic amino acids transporter-like [Watersipora subatra]|uniref:mitochondrial basic amino acids transporter-like n=1 Tax=Watersipora subatra TaxID=2589382 RepID=UPI00355B2444